MEQEVEPGKWKPVQFTSRSISETENKLLEYRTRGFGDHMGVRDNGRIFNRANVHDPDWPQASANITLKKGSEWAKNSNVSDEVDKF